MEFLRSQSQEKEEKKCRHAKHFTNRECTKRRETLRKRQEPAGKGKV